MISKIKIKAWITLGKEYKEYLSSPKQVSYDSRWYNWCHFCSLAEGQGKHESAPFCNSCLIWNPKQKRGFSKKSYHEGTKSPCIVWYNRNRTLDLGKCLVIARTVRKPNFVKIRLPKLDRQLNILRRMLNGKK